MNLKPSFTGHSRGKKTRWSIRVYDVLAKTLITFAGIGTIIAILLICGFLVSVVFPLFQGSVAESPSSFPLKLDSKPIAIGMDEYRTLGWAFEKDGNLQTFRLDQGSVLQKILPKKLYRKSPIVSFTRADRGDQIAIGFLDGTVQMGKIGFQSRILKEGEITGSMATLKEGDLLPHEVRNEEFTSALVQKTASGVFRSQAIRLELETPLEGRLQAPLVALDMTVSPNSPLFLASISGDGTITTSSLTTEEDILTGEKKTELVGGKLSLGDSGKNGLPRWLRVMGKGEAILLVWENGHAVRVATQPVKKPKIIEEKNLLPAGGNLKITALEMLLGRGTMIVGDSGGNINCWFKVPELLRQGEAGISADKHTLVSAHTFAGNGTPVTSLASSALSRTIAAGYADGIVKALFVTSEKKMLELVSTSGVPVESVLIAPKDNSLLAMGGGKLHTWSIRMMHPEITFKSLLAPIWYEGYPKPAHVWQPAGGSDESEGKFGILPLIFGTLKATFYSLLIGVPLAFMAAVYTSEFMHRKTRAVVKPVIEMMASLPSVILGFLAALVVAPFVNRMLPSVFASFITIPGSIFFFAYLWQLLPYRLSLYLERWRILFLVFALLLGIYLSPLVGGLIESVFFGNNLKGWLNNPVHKNGSSGWFFLLLPLGLVTSILMASRWLNPFLRNASRSYSPFATALLDIVKGIGILVISSILAFGGGVMLSAIGLDPRDSLLGIYDQQNALVVGFMMGFAIIPIVYTISEDALALVPEHLRSASLGCGATRWQTATRIIIPTAMSGLFSALMVGLGRAVGETMIVLMAAGGTPIMDMNIFNGFRTLSATIATELPDTVKEGTHYRTLFLAALTLFLMTFFFNTIAELVRLRFRKRVYQL